MTQEAHEEKRELCWKAPFIFRPEQKQNASAAPQKQDELNRPELKKPTTAQELVTEERRGNSNLPIN